MADAEEGGWIRTFSRVVELEVWAHVWGSDRSEVPLVPLHNFSPVLKSLRIISATILHSEILNLICSLHLLEDLCVVDNGKEHNDRDRTAFQHLTSPVLTGTLELHLVRGAEHIARRLLTLPNGLHFRKLVWTWYLEEDVRWMTALVAECSDTLECIDVEYRPSGMYIRLHHFDRYFT